MDPQVGLTAMGQFELARAAGFDTYEDFVAWKEREPEAYERWYAGLKAKAGKEEG